MLAELDYRGKTTPELFQWINLRLAYSVTARNALGRTEKEFSQEIATMLYGEVRPYGQFRFVNFGHPLPLVFSAEYRKFMEIDRSRMVQFLPLGLQIPEDHPDRNRYLWLEPPHPQAESSEVAELRLMSPGDILFLYTDGVYDGSDKDERQQLESVMREHYQLPPKDICSAFLDYAVKRDERLRQTDQEFRIDDKTVFIIKRS
jgi:serine phosphatase RsbU (regulator of sigma subunit)